MRLGFSWRAPLWISALWVCAALAFFGADGASSASLATGAGLCLVGGALCVWTDAFRGGLVVAGPYRFARHPALVGKFLALFGLAVTSRDALIVAIAAVTGAILARQDAGADEENAEKRFGSQFEAYRRQVPAFVPQLFPYRATSDHAVTPPRLSAPTRDTLLFLGSLAAVLAGLGVFYWFAPGQTAQSIVAVICLVLIVPIQLKYRAKAVVA